MLAPELSTYVGNPGELITVTGYNISGDGGGGVFEWITNTPDPDGGIVFGIIKKGRWRRLWSGYVNVRWFGAWGDGIERDHGVDGIGDRKYIQDAICYCAKLPSGGTVFFPPGIYIVASRKDTDTYKIQLRSKVNLLGCGNASQLRSAAMHPQNPSSRTLVSVEGEVLRDVTIESLLIDGQESQQKHDPNVNVERTAIFIYESQGLRIANCVFQNTADAIRLRGAGHLVRDKQRMCVGARVTGNEIRNNDVDISRECIIIDGAYDCILENNYIHDCPYATAIKMEGAPPGVDFSNLIRGNVCRSVGAGITVKGGCIVSDNLIEAVVEEGAIVGHHCHFTGNRIVSAVGVGISLISSNDTTEDVIVANNFISNVTARNEPTCDDIVAEFRINKAGLYYQPQNLKILGNIIDNRNADPTSNAKFNGIRLRSSGTQTIVSDNHILAADTGIKVVVEAKSRIASISLNSNVITLPRAGTGVWVSSNSAQESILEHACISGNMVEPLGPAAADTIGLYIQGDPGALIVTDNDTSATTYPLKTAGGPGTPYVHANNIGF